MLPIQPQGPPQTVARPAAAGPSLPNPPQPPPARGDSFVRSPLDLLPDPRRQPQRPELIHPGTDPFFRAQLEPILAGLPLALLQAVVDEGYCLHVIDLQGRQPLTLELEPVQEGEPWLDGRLLKPCCWEFLTQPQRSFVAGMVLHELSGLLPGRNRILFWDCAFERGDGLLDWYVLHELGHTLDYALAFRRPEVWRAWCARLEAARQQAEQRERLITRYAGTDLHEYLAEGFAAWGRSGPSPEQGLHGDLAAQRHLLHQAELRRLDRPLYDLIEQALELL